MYRDLRPISIHVPARGTTPAVLLEDEMPEISIHVPARGTTQGAMNEFPRWKFQSTYPHGVRRRFQLLRRSIWNFNPRTRTGYDSPTSSSRCGRSISIHVPARGTTPVFTRIEERIIFQSTYPHGVRHGSTVTPAAACTFQSTYPHGVRPNFLDLPEDPSEFQSTYPHGVRRRKTAR